jgi:hypothetical protein
MSQFVCPGAVGMVLYGPVLNCMYTQQSISFFSHGHVTHTALQMQRCLSLESVGATPDAGKPVTYALHRSIKFRGLGNRHQKA